MDGGVLAAWRAHLFFSSVLVSRVNSGTLFLSHWQKLGYPFLPYLSFFSTLNSLFCIFPSPRHIHDPSFSFLSPSSSLHPLKYQTSENLQIYSIPPTPQYTPSTDRIRVNEPLQTPQKWSRSSTSRTTMYVFPSFFQPPSAIAFLFQWSPRSCKVSQNRG